MRQGDYIEVEGELHSSDYESRIVAAGESFPAKHSVYEVHALQIRRLEYPAIGVDEGDG